VEEKSVINDIIDNIKGRYEKELNIFNEYFDHEKELHNLENKEVNLD